MKTLRGREVLARLRRGESLHASGANTLTAVFDDGARVSHAVMYRLVRAGLITRDKDSLYCPWALAGEGESK